MTEKADANGWTVLSAEKTIGAIIDDHAQRTPDKTAISGTGIGQISYRALVHQIAKMRDAFRNAGIGSDARIGVILPSGIEAVVTTIAASSHATCMPFNSAISYDDLIYELKRFPLDAVILPDWLELPSWKTANDYPCTTLAVNKTEGSLDKFMIRCIRSVTAYAADSIDPKSRSEALVLRTSATTGLSKLVPVTQGNMIEQANKMFRWLGVTNSDRVACILPTYYAQGCQTGVLIPLLLGGSVTIPGAGLRDTQASWITDLAPTWFSAGPTFLLGLLDALRQSGRAEFRHSLRFVLSSSAHLPPQVRERLEEVLGVPVLEFYGLSEAGMMAANPPPPRRRKPGTAGLVPEGELAIRDRLGNIARSNKVGEIFIRGPSVTPGYIVDDSPRRDGLHDGWLPTGDLGSIDEEGFLTIAGRLKEIINRGGEKISPVEIDQTMLRHPDVREAAAFGVPHPRLGENVAMAVVLKPGAAATASDLRAFVTERLLAFKVPQRIDVIDSIPKGQTGKVLRNSLRERALRQVRTHTPAEELLEIQIVEIWKRLLKTNQIGIDDDFFEAGGDSLLAEQMLLEVETIVDRQIPTSALSEASTIRGIAVIAASGNEGDTELLTKVLDAPGTPFFYCHGDFGSRGFYALKLARLINPPQPFYLIHPLREVDENTDLNIKAMARQYVSLLLTARPEGPFRLGGHCNGGLLAIEIANQLAGLGRKVELVIVIESISINCRWFLRLANSGIRILGTILPSAKYRRRLAREGMLCIWEIYEFGVLKGVRPTLRIICSFLFRSQRSESGCPSQQKGRSSVYLRAISEQDRRSPAYLRAMANYVPPKLQSTLVVINAETSKLEPSKSVRAWKSRTQIVHSAIVPGDHLSCIAIETTALAECISLFLKV